MSFSQFLKEKQFLHNASPATLEWYKQSLRKLGIESPTEKDLKNFVLRMAEQKLKPSGINCRIRAVNAYLKWGGSPLRVPKMKEPTFIPPTFSPSQVKLLVGFKPKGFCQRRLHLLSLIMLDVGCRVSECTLLKVADCDLENLLMTLFGKGRKQRVVPFSLELRRILFRYVQDFSLAPHMFLLGTRRGRRLDRHVVSRDMRKHCARLGFSQVRLLHCFRSTMATNYIRANGNPLFLQRILGHSGIAQTMKYVALVTEDLQAAHEQRSLLGRGRLTPRDGA